MIIFENKNTCFIYVIWEHNIIISISQLKVFFNIANIKKFQQKTNNIFFKQ